MDQKSTFTRYSNSIINRFSLKPFRWLCSPIGVRKFSTKSAKSKEKPRHEIGANENTTCKRAESDKSHMDTVVNRHITKEYTVVKHNNTILEIKIDGLINLELK